MGRSLRRLEQYVGIDGIALLRLYHSDDTSVADDIVAELRALLDTVDGGSPSQDVYGARLDVAAGYRRWAAVYDAPGNSLLAHEGPVVRAILERSEGEPVLDAACGTGRHLRWLHAQGRRVVGIDQSQEMLARAAAKVPGADLQVGDLLALPVAAHSVAGTICALALEHVADLNGAYGEFARVVLPGGWVVTSSLHPLVSQVLGWGTWFADDEGRGDVESHLYSLSDHLNAAVSAGLQVAECVEVPLDSTWLASRPPQVATGWPIAHDGLPLVLVLRFINPG